MKFVQKSEFISHIIEYELFLQEKELSTSTRKKYIGDIRRFIKYLDENDFMMLDCKVMEQYKEYLESHYAVQSYNSYLISLNAYFRYLHLDYLISKIRKMSQKSSLENVISMEEYNKLLDYAALHGDDMMYFIMRTLATTGIRVSELKYITFEAVNSRKAVVTAKNKTREIYLSDSLSYDLCKYCIRHKISKGIIFLSMKTKMPLGNGTIWRKMKSIAKAAQVDPSKVYPHSFRHLFAKTYIEKFRALDELADLLGHSSIETTRIYTRTTEEEKRSRMNALGL